MSSRAYLVVLGHRDSIVWVLREQRMAVPRTMRGEAAKVAEGDTLFLYATRRSWNNVVRDRGRIFGVARAMSGMRPLEAPVELGGRLFHAGFDLSIRGIVPFPGGVEIGLMADRLETFRQPKSWSAYLRRPLLRVAEADVGLLTEALQPLLVPDSIAADTYKLREE